MKVFRRSYEEGKFLFKKVVVCISDCIYLSGSTNCNRHVKSVGNGADYR